MGVRNWQIWYDNLITAGSMITPDDENANYPKENMLEMNYHSTFRSATAPDPFTIKIDFGSAKSFDSMILGNRNDFSLKYLQFSDDDITYSNIVGISLSNFSRNNINCNLYRDIGSGSHRYYKIQIHLESAITYYEIGILMLCNEYVFPEQPGIPFDMNPQINEDILLSPTGYETRYKNYEKYKWTLDFKYIAVTFYDILKSLNEFFFCPDSDDYTKTYLCKRKGSPVKKEQNFDYCDTRIDVEELL